MAKDSGIEKFVNSLLKNLESIDEEVNKKVENAKDALDSLVEMIQRRKDAEVGESSKIKDPAEDGKSSTTKYKADETNKIPCSFDDEKIMRQNHELALCCYSLSVFPPNTLVKKRWIIYWWMGLGLLPLGTKNTAEDAGETFFNDLVSLGVIIPRELRCSRKVDGCIIEPEVHKKLIDIAERRNIIRKIDRSGGSQRGGSSHGNSQRGDGCFHGSDGIQLYEILTKKGKSRALINFGQRVLKSDCIVELLKTDNNPRLGALLLGHFCMELEPPAPIVGVEKNQISGQNHDEVKPYHVEVDKIDFLKELKSSLTILGLRGVSRITQLPDSIGSDHGELVILSLRACHDLEKLPPEIKSMNMLTHLDVSGCYLLDNLPSWVSTLTNLEVLKGFVIGSSRRKTICRLGGLSHLKKLRKLTMTIRRTSVVDEGEEESLKALSKLLSLTIIWGKDACEPCGQLKERICPPPQLEKLDFRCYRKTVMPEWFNPENLPSLKRLYIRGGKLVRFENKGNANSNEGWNIEILRLRFLMDFEMPSHEVGAVFTKLEILEYWQNCKVEEFKNTDGCWRKERDGPIPSDAPKQSGSGNDEPLSSDAPKPSGSGGDGPLPSRPGRRKQAIIKWMQSRKKMAGKNFSALGEWLSK